MPLPRHPAPSNHLFISTCLGLFVYIFQSVSALRGGTTLNLLCYILMDSCAYYYGLLDVGWGKEVGWQEGPLRI